MVNDLQIAGIKLPPVVESVCPTTIDVAVINAGPDPAHFPRPMDVCLEIRTSLEEGRAEHYVVSTPIESPAILPGDIRVFTFTGVEFPCAPSAIVTATADCSGSVPDNARSAPALTLPAVTLIPVPWLWTKVRVGLKDSTGYVNWTPGALCPGATCVTEVNIVNRGCAAAIASTTELELIDGAGQSIGVQKQSTPSIAGQAATTIQFTTTLPTSATGNRITLRACADSKGVVTGQCDLVHGCAEVTLPLATTSTAPTLTLVATRPVVPAENVPIVWRLQNFCSDIGKATAQISFQGNPIPASLVPISIGLQDTGGEDLDLFIPSSVAPSFYKIGTSKLTLVVTGTGNDPGPYIATAMVTVIPESVSGTWSFTVPAPGVPAAFPWKAPFTVEGRLANPARASMLPSSVVLDEVSTVGAAMGRIASPPIGTIVPGAFGTSIWSLVQAWSWLVPGVWIPKGPMSGTFTYTVTFAMQDQYGNAYPASTSSSTVITISVSGLKIGLAATALTMFGIGVGLVAVAIILFAISYITAAVAGILLAIAGVVFTISTGFGLGALDPPAPNFDYHRVEKVSVARLPVETAAESAVAPLLPVVALLARITALNAAMSATEARLIAARIDREPDATQLQWNEYAALRDSLLAAAEHVPMAVSDAIDGLRAEPALLPLFDAEALQRQTASWSRRGVPARLRQAWLERGLAEERLHDIEQAVRDPDFSVQPLDALLGDLNQAVALIARGTQEAADTVLYPLTSA